MYVAGETQEPSTPTIALVESIIKDQVILMLTTANDLAGRRGSKVFSNNDLIFQFRHDSARVARLQTFLRWKSIRRQVKDSDDKGAPEVAGADDIDNDTLEGSMAPDGAAKKTRLPAAVLPWEVRFFYAEQVPGDDVDEDVLADSNMATLKKLRRADVKTRDMTVEEYATWSECRHASFTWRKVKRFREWAGLGVIAEHKPADDSLDILGFVTYEMVERLTEIALAFQEHELRSTQGLEYKQTPSFNTNCPGPFAPLEMRNSSAPKSIFASRLSWAAGLTLGLVCGAHCRDRRARDLLHTKITAIPVEQKAYR
ncbi:hypothetical protein G7Z17_g1604 [Cylindrodendrum hubeiense]|uniref:Spt3 n=1 Tax=Cylindrodendrum hubeiense TaxID=595255 RepID=A0A9P5LLY5_9HYPO|nr:hypothetical protein G7Z17_g1604 [Cylindrodendrum hubeiense]